MDVRLRLREEHLDPRLPLLGFHDDDLFDLLTRIPAIGADPAAVARLNELAAALVAHLDDPGAELYTDDDADHPLGAGLLPMLAMIATADDVVQRLREREIPDELGWHSLSDLGQQVWVHRQTFGEFGLHTHRWLRIAWAGRLFWLGRLQYELAALDGGGWEASIHIPQTGSLTPAAVDESLALAEEFFARHFPDRLPVRYRCTSWLLDPELGAGLPGSNIASFAERFELTEQGTSPGDADAIFFTYRRRGTTDPAALPRRTSLERLVADRLAAGQHWQVRTGILSAHG
ncbi:hypothetical protein CGZ95_06855 [Enemella evansiae]|uniref:acyltransferase domain-containing protein n=1 Tax=Enemella evansiae TaxID=2016499 RepID=UPI000B969B5E|nr:acyltransferase domain-containing protein [Enemella evansiae]OYO01496.1 hypothetical protein CGZ95_06855 [Enemella evansiae]